MRPEGTPYGSCTQLRIRLKSVTWVVSIAEASTVNRLKNSQIRPAIVVINERI